MEVPRGGCRLIRRHRSHAASVHGYCNYLRKLAISRVTIGNMPSPANAPHRTCPPLAVRDWRYSKKQRPPPPVEYNRSAALLSHEVPEIPGVFSIARGMPRFNVKAL